MVANNQELRAKSQKPNAMQDELIEGVDYYWEDGFMVFTSVYLLKRGFCCRSGCRHCPYGFVKEEE